MVWSGRTVNKAGTEVIGRLIGLSWGERGWRISFRSTLEMAIRKIHRWIVNLADWSKFSRLGTLIIVQIHSIDSNLGKIIRISTRYRRFRKI